MNTSTESTAVARYADGRIWVTLPNGVNISFPIRGNWRLEDAAPAQLNHIEVNDEGLHWPELDEDLSFAGLLRGDYGQFVKRPAACEV